MGCGYFESAASESLGGSAATLDEAGNGQPSFPAMEEVVKALEEVNKNNPVPAKDNVAKGIDESEPKKVGASLGEGGKTMDPFGDDTPASPSPRQYRFDMNAVRVEAIQYLNRIKAFYPDEPEVFDAFLGILLAFRHGELDRHGVIDEVEVLFAGNDTLLEGFNAFLPPGYHCGRREWSFS